MVEENRRDNFSKSTIDALCKRAAFICSNPDCRIQTLSPSSIEDRFEYVGKAAHICAAAPGGPRYRAEMTTEQRAGIGNGIFLCSICADRIDKNNGEGHPENLLRAWKDAHERWVKENLNKTEQGRGGDGGSGTIVGNRGTVIGGRGGKGGVSGIGGSGGSGTIHGDDGLVVGGDGGDAAALDGRGGRGARGPTERFGHSTSMWGFGRGGSSPNAPEYDRRLALLQQFQEEYLSKFTEDARYIKAGVDRVPVDWVNQRLNEIGEDWCVQFGEIGHLLPALLTK